MKSGIYMIINIHSKLVYVGQSINVKNRLMQHKSGLSSGKKSHTKTNTRLINSFNKHGESAFKFEVLEYCDHDLLTKREQYWLDEFRIHHGYPVANFNGPVDSPMLGERQRDSTRRAISAALKGRKMSEHHISLTRRTGTKASIDTKEKMRIAKKGVKRLFTNDQLEMYSGFLKNNQVREASIEKIRRPVVDTKTGETWRTLTCCANFLGVSVPAVANNVAGRTITCKGRKLAYAVKN